MAVGGIFDQWQKDVFFSAAEEVQESADVTLSVYRVWMRHRKDGFDAADELCRELQIALGTAKWQLDEFERAIKLNHDSCSVEETTIARHRQFITAIKNQILEVEKELSNSVNEERKQSFRWVQLNKDERDDLAAFLSGRYENARERQAKVIKHDASSTKMGSNMDNKSISNDTTGNDKDERCIIEVLAKESSESKIVERSTQPEESNEPETSSSLDNDSWKIVIVGDEGTSKRLVEGRQEAPKYVPHLYRLLRGLEFTAKFKWFKNSFRKAKTEEHFPSHDLSNYLDKRVNWLAQGINGLTERSRNCYSSCTEDPKISISQQLNGRGNGVQRNIQGSHYFTQFSHTLRITFLLVLSIILIVPVVLYST